MGSCLTTAGILMNEILLLKKIIMVIRFHYHRPESALAMENARDILKPR